MRASLNVLNAFQPFMSPAKRLTDILFSFFLFLLVAFLRMQAAAVVRKCHTLITNCITIGSIVYLRQTGFVYKRRENYENIEIGYNFKQNLNWNLPFDWSLRHGNVDQIPKRRGFFFGPNHFWTWAVATRSPAGWQIWKVYKETFHHIDDVMERVAKEIPMLYVTNNKKTDLHNNRL